MSEERWRSGTFIAMGVALVVSTAMITGVVVANWNNKETARPTSAVSKAPVQQAPTRPSASDIEGCNQYARSAAGNTPMDVLEKAVIGGALGAGVGAAGGAIGGGGKGAGKGAAIGGIVGATAGTLYGLNEANRNDARATAAYRSCMRARGHTN